MIRVRVDQRQRRYLILVGTQPSHVVIPATLPMLEINCCQRETLKISKENVDLSLG
jgi:hypothetical protein